MAQPVLTWGNVFGYVQWNKPNTPDFYPEYTLIQAKTAENSLLFVGPLALPYEFELQQSYNEGDIAYIVSYFGFNLNQKYVPFLIGKLVTPGGQGFPNTPMDYPVGAYVTPGPPTAITSQLIETSYQPLDNPSRVYYYQGIDAIEGFIGTPADPQPA